jgi:membrane protease YdiL (CAAX protease family)
MKFMGLNSVLFNHTGRLRSGWRFAVFVALFIVISGLIGVAAHWFLSSSNLDYGPGTPVFLATNGVLSLAAALLVGWVCGKLLEDLPFRALGSTFTPGWLRNLFVGLVLGAASISFAILIAVLFGGLSFRFNSEHSAPAITATVFGSLLIFIPAAAFEEALFRGYILQTFTRAGLAWLAIGLTAVFFGMVHLGNPGSGTISSINTAIAGIWFGVAYLKTRDLWLPFGLHLTWNWFQGSIFGVEVSGLTDFAAAPLLKEIDGGPAWLTGEMYGIEGGVAATIALIASTVAIYFLPGLKPGDEMLAMTSNENPRRSVS